MGDNKKEEWLHKGLGNKEDSIIVELTIIGGVLLIVQKMPTSAKYQWCTYGRWVFSPKRTTANQIFICILVKVSCILYQL